MEERAEWTRAALVLGGCMMVGLIVGGYLLGTEVRDFKRADRYVAVKGLVERTVKSDSAIWTMTFTVYSDELPSAYTQSNTLAGQLKSYLAAQHIAASEIGSDSLDVTDRIDNANRKGPRYAVAHTLVVQSGDVERVQSANNGTGSLISQGIVLSTNNVTYKFNGLNALKPDMITEATRNARAAADRFAADSGSKVGAIRDANQGVFSISAANSAPMVNEDQGVYSADQQADASIMKKVRVVSTIDYYLQN